MKYSRILSEKPMHPILVPVFTFIFKHKTTQFLPVCFSGYFRFSSMSQARQEDVSSPGCIDASYVCKYGGQTTARSWCSNPATASSPKPNLPYIKDLMNPTGPQHPPYQQNGAIYGSGPSRLHSSCRFHAASTVSYATDSPAWYSV